MVVRVRSAFPVDQRRLEHAQLAAPTRSLFIHACAARVRVLLVADDCPASRLSITAALDHATDGGSLGGNREYAICNRTLS